MFGMTKNVKLNKEKIMHDQNYGNSIVPLILQAASYK